MSASGCIASGEHLYKGSPTAHLLQHPLQHKSIYPVLAFKVWLQALQPRGTQGLPSIAGDETRLGAADLGYDSCTASSLQYRQAGRQQCFSGGLMTL